MLPTAALLALTVAPLPSHSPFEFQDGDRVVWIGNTLVEREQRYGHWESLWLIMNRGKKITFRNLGWSGDTVFGAARAGFDDPAKGFERLVSLTLELKPTVVIISYGTNESFEREAGLEKFEKGLNRLLDALKPSQARLILTSPTPFEKSPGVADVDARNRALELYGKSIEKIAAERKASFVDLFGQIARLSNGPVHRFEASPWLTDNGMHYTDSGYRQAFVCLQEGGSIQQDLAAITSQYDQLRKAVIAKNQLFFYRWRPQNETYLLGFRKHEQGKNAKEIAEFDPLINKAEDEIQALLKTIK